MVGGDIGLGDWRQFEQLERLQRRRFEQFSKTPWAEGELAALRVCLSHAVPRPADTEVRFWSVTVRPESGFIRVNAGQQEVFTYESAGASGAIRIFTTDRVGWLRSWRSPDQIPSFETALSADKLDR